MRLLLFIILTFFTTALRAEGDAALFAEWELKASYREDPGGMLSLEKVLQLPSEGWTKVPPPPKGLNLGFKREPHWFRLPLPPCQAGDRLIYEIAYPLLDRLDVWFLGPNGPTGPITTGDTFPYQQRPLEHIGFGFPYTCGQHHEVIVRAHTTSSMQLPMNVWEVPAFDRHLLAIERPQLLYFGAVLIMALYNFFIFLIVRRPPYLHYVLFVLSFATFQAGISGLGFRYIWPTFPTINTHIIDKSINCIGIFAFSFTLSFLNASTLTPRLYRFGLWLLAALVAYTCVTLLLPGIIDVRISIVFVTSAILIAFSIAAHSIARRQREGYFYGLAWTTFLFGTIALSLNKLGVLPRTAFTEYSQQVSSVLEMLLLSFALADQMNILRFNLAQSHEKLEKTLQSIEEIVNQKTQSIRSIMDTLQVGIITITSQQFLIEAEYSRHTEAWLGEQQLGGKPFPDVFLNHLVLGEDAKALIISALQAIMDEPHENFEFNGFHLPQEARLLTASGTKDIVLDWTPILNNEGRVVRILIAFHDVTELRSLKQEQASQSRMLIRLNQLLSADDMALRVFLIHGRRTMDFMYDPITAGRDIPLLVQRLFVDFHTLKGESRSLGLTELSDQFHLMEDRLDQVRRDVRLWNAGTLLQDIGRVETLMSEFASLYESHIGSLTEERVVPIRQGTLEHWERALQRLHPHGSDEGAAHRLLLNDLFHILHMDLKTYEEKLQNQARRMAREMGKPDPQVLLAGQGIFLSQRLVQQLDHVFIHILQNSLVHGLESADERKAAGKSLAGLIYIRLTHVGDEVELIARDDGRGVNIQAIREKALEWGLLTADEEMSDQKLESCLLHAGLSCREDVGAHAGRGVGMGAVKQFVEELSGRMYLDFAPERDGYRTFALVMILPAALFPMIDTEPLQAA